MMQEFDGKRPAIDDSAFVHEGATVIGDVEIGPDCSIWPGAVLRGDRTEIRIGDTVSIQDNATVHSTSGYPVGIASHVTVGHNCIIHGAKVGEGCLIGMGSILMNGVVLGESCLVGAGALLTEGKEYPARSIIIGLPGKVVGEVSDEKAQWMREKAKSYAELAKDY